MQLQRSVLSRQRGFTLVELMIVVAIVGILAIIGYPSYNQFVQKGRRAEAKAALLSTMQLFERHFAQVNSYAPAPGSTTAWTGFNTYSGDSPSSSNYTIGAALCAGSPVGAQADQCVELTATPVAGKADTTCGSLIYRSTGEKLYLPPGAPTAINAGTGTSNCW
ncbi:type IV pilin protein [Ralstonia sp. VS2407]